jgi:two-component sensor histidine kinase
MPLVLRADLLDCLLDRAYAILLARKSSRKGFDIFLFLPDSYEISESDLWERTVSSLNECAEASGEARELCHERGVEGRRAAYVPLLIEETTSNVVEHGFPEGKGSVVMVRILFDKDRIILSIKDDCRYFNPIHYYAARQGRGDGADDYGLRIVMSIAKKVSYTNCFNLNNLRIEV